MLVAVVVVFVIHAGSGHAWLFLLRRLWSGDKAVPVEAKGGHIRSFMLKRDVPVVRKARLYSIFGYADGDLRRSAQNNTHDESLAKEVESLINRRTADISALSTCCISRERTCHTGLTTAHSTADR